VQYRIQFLDGMASVILDLVADARDAASAIALVVDLDWPPNAVSMRLLDEDGREGSFGNQGATSSEGRTTPSRYAFKAASASTTRTRLMSAIVAQRLVVHLERSGFVVMKKPPIGGAAALGRGHEGRS
jgi:hypothetical protein